MVQSECSNGLFSIEYKVNMIDQAMQDLLSKRKGLKCVFLGHLGNESILMNGRYNHFISAIMFPLTLLIYRCGI